MRHYRGGDAIVRKEERSTSHGFKVYVSANIDIALTEKLPIIPFIADKDKLGPEDSLDHSSELHATPPLLILNF